MFERSFNNLCPVLVVNNWTFSSVPVHTQSWCYHLWPMNLFTCSVTNSHYLASPVKFTIRVFTKKHWSQEKNVILFYLCLRQHSNFWRQEYSLVTENKNLQIQPQRHKGQRDPQIWINNLLRLLFFGFSHSVIHISTNGFETFHLPHVPSHVLLLVFYPCLTHSLI